MKHRSLIDVRPDGITVRIESTHAGDCVELLRNAAYALECLHNMDAARKALATDKVLAGCCGNHK
jgi:hypothetical protein